MVGAWAPFYDYLAKLIRNSTWFDMGNTPVTDAQIILMRSVGSISPDSMNSLIWLMGGTNVNSNTGVFNSLIRLYNVRQGEMRLGVTFQNDLLQMASNEVARRMGNQILGDPNDPVNNPGNGGFIPNVQEIGEEDLNGVRDVLWGEKFDGEPMYLNQAWPGIVLLGAQGMDFLGRLLQPDTKSEESALNSLGDLKNLLYAWESFKYAFDHTCASNFNLVSEFAIFVGLANKDLVISALSGMPSEKWAAYIFDELIKNQNPDARDALKIIHKLSSAEFLDMVRRTWTGATTEVIDFVSESRGFFNQFSAADLNGIGVKLLKGSDFENLKDAAITDESLRNALKQLSFVDIELPSYDGRGLDLYDPKTGSGTLSEEWIEDRTAMLSWFFKLNSENKTATIGNPYNPIGSNTSRQYFYDFATEKELFLGQKEGSGANELRRRFIFGDDNTNTIDGAAKNDRLLICVEN